MRGVARVDDDRVHLRPVGRAVLHAAHPRAELRIIVDNGERVPGDATVVGAEQALRRGPGVPRVGLVRMARCEPEGVIDRTPLLALGHFGERRWPGGFLPCATEIGGTKNGRTEVTGFRSTDFGRTWKEAT